MAPTSTFSMVRGLPFVLAETVGVLAFMSFANWYDTGRWSSDGWQAMTASGLLCGSALYLAESRRSRVAETWHRSRVRFAVRAIALSTGCIACSFAVGLFAMLVATGGNWVVLGLLVVPLTTLMLLPMMIPFGVLSGLAGMAILLSGRGDTHASGVL